MRRLLQRFAIGRRLRDSNRRGSAGLIVIVVRLTMVVGPFFEARRSAVRE